ncbi:hypothetical protein [Gottfriedia solisilvae]|uniref:hypothetical protein n=1 Tax=Gottfriedia solisilvae TaxID=1516104 RepID=UPI003D2F407C
MLSYKRKYLFFTSVILLVLSLVSCDEKLDGKTIISASVSRVGESMLDVKKPHITYNQENSEELQTFVDAIKKAKKVSGIVDVATPGYLITLTYEDKTISNYSLWIDDAGGSIMNENDSNHIYTLRKDLIDDLNKLVE